MAKEELSSNLTNISTDITVAVIALIVLFTLVGTLVGTGGDISGTYQKTSDWFYSEKFQKTLNNIGVVFAVINALLLVFIIWVLRRHEELRKKPILEKETTPIGVETVYSQKEAEENWTHIRELANSQNPSDWNMAILRADALLDDILRHLGYEGETIADKLKIVDTTKLASIDRVWSAHRLRNSIAHDPLEQHTKETVIHALRSYELALKELGVMG